MELAEAAETVLFVLEQDQKEQAMQIWLHSSTQDSFAEFWERCKGKKAQEIRSSEDILAETDALFMGR